jgi:hypothetical protein
MRHPQWQGHHLAKGHGSGPLVLFVWSYAGGSLVGILLALLRGEQWYEEIVLLWHTEGSYVGAVRARLYTVYGSPDPKAPSAQ